MINFKLLKKYKINFRLIFLKKRRINLQNWIMLNYSKNNKKVSDKQFSDKANKISFIKVYLNLSFFRRSKNIYGDFI